jgi:hypothetical protein
MFANSIHTRVVRTDIIVVTVDWGRKAGSPNTSVLGTGVIVITGDWDILALPSNT